ncbi:protein FAR1-RELATED SEQUENCE 5-like [Rutidosis leptorrhynchoides]|uniref:protein FAR1-RELATED SEQUENCE 5-like n=1 Tax=Rutidosis leptorrhynchoides TaxID=125765 RepID=UPI003A9A3ED2
MDNSQEYEVVNDNLIEGVNFNKSEIQNNDGEYNIPLDPIIEDDIWMEDAGGSSSRGVLYTPNGSRYYIPEVPLTYKPVEGTIWDSYDEARAMYEAYADKAGFTVRKSLKKRNKGDVSHRYLLCSKEGKPRTKKSVDTLQKDKHNIQDTSLEQNVKKPERAKRNSNIKVTDCKARIKLKLIKGTNQWVFYGFEECHNHPLDEEEDKHLSRSQRQLEFEDQLFILTVGMNNIGPTKAYRDAQMLINKFAKRKLNNPELSYEYKTEEDELIGFFWADETSKCNYKEFGDVCGELLENTDLRRRIHKIVWDVWLTNEKFETRWTSLIEEFNLQDNSWLADMFKIRDRWVPGYFSHLPMCCIMKTTSRAESANHFFHIFTDPGHTLVQFMICFESAMEKQRHMHQVLDYQTKKVEPSLVTQLSIEVHASTVYTLAIFWKVQKEIYRSVWFCSQRVISSDDFREVSEIRDVNQKTKVVSRHEVVQNKLEDTISCSCNHFGRHGWLCRHIFCVFKSNQVEEIPQQYIKRRWCKDTLPKDLLDKRHRYGMETGENTKLCTSIINDVEVIVSRLRNDPQKLSDFAAKIKQFKVEVLQNQPDQSAHKNKQDVMSCWE